MNVLERPHEHVARERLHHALQSTQQLLSRRKRRYSDAEMTKSLQRLMSQAAVVSDRVSSARDRPILDASAAAHIADAVKDLNAALHALGVGSLRPAGRGDTKDASKTGPF